MVVEAQGMSFGDAKGMIRTRPEVNIERDARTSFLRSMVQLRLNLEPPPPPLRFPWEPISSEEKETDDDEEKSDPS